MITIETMHGSAHDALDFHNRDMSLARKLLKQRYMQFDNGELFVFVKVSELIKEIKINYSLLETLGKIYRKCLPLGSTVKSHDGDVLEAMTGITKEARHHIEDFCKENVADTKAALMKYYYNKTIEHTKYFLGEGSDPDTQFRLGLFYCLPATLSSHRHEDLVSALILLLNGDKVSSRNIQENADNNVVLFDSYVTENKDIDKAGIVAIRKSVCPLIYFTKL